MKKEFNGIVCLLLATSALQAGTLPEMTTTQEPRESPWSFRIAPYAWLTAVDGDISVGPVSAPVDISFSDTLDKLDMAFMGVVELGYDRWMLSLDYVYAKFSNDIPGGGVFFDSFRYDYSQWALTPTLGHRVIDTDTYRMDIFAGARIQSLDATLTGRFVGGGQTQLSGDETWADPLIGIRGQADFTDRWFFRYNVDIGGFGVSSDLVWQAFAGLGYNITDSASVGVGYRGMGVDYSVGPLEIDLFTHGPVLGFELRF